MSTEQPNLAPPPEDAATPDAAAEALSPAEREARAMRVSMAGKLADIIVLPAGRLSANERSVAADMLLKLLTKLSEGERATIATRIARVSECPPALTRFFLRDAPGVSEAILRAFDAVPDALLIECAREGVAAHRTLIARRLNLSSAVIDALVEFNEPDTARAILRRTDVSLSPIAIDRLVATSAVDPEMQTLLLRRKEIEPAHGFLMFWWVRGERRKRILARFSVDRAIIQEAFRDLYPIVFQAEAPDPYVKEILVMNDRRHHPRGLNGERVSMDVVKRTLALAYKNPSQEAIAAVGMIAGVSRDLAGRILRDADGEPYAVLCKAMGVGRDDFYNFVHMAEESVIGADPAAKRAEDLLSIFDAIARDFSRAVVRYWDWKGNPRLEHVVSMLDAGLEASESLA